MPTVTEKPVTAFAHCPTTRPRPCPGNRQEEVEAVRRETARTYREMGGDAPGVECSWVSLVFADEEQLHCEHCGKARDLSSQRRVQYDPQGEWDPNPLALLGAPEFDPARQAEVRQQPLGDPEREAFEAQLAAQQEQMAAMQEQMRALTEGAAPPVEEA